MIRSARTASTLNGRCGRLEPGPPRGVCTARGTPADGCRTARSSASAGSTRGSGVALDVGTDYVPPRNAVEQRLADVWQSVLGAPRVGIDDNYFSLGGDSIKAIQILSRLRQHNLRMEIRDLFRDRTIRSL